MTLPGFLEYGAEATIDAGEPNSQMNDQSNVAIKKNRKKKNSKEVCRFYQRNGRCRYGAKCKFSHNVEITAKAEESDQYSLWLADSGANVALSYERAAVINLTNINDKKGPVVKGLGNACISP